jgi:hypothetical protein
MYRIQTLLKPQNVWVNAWVNILRLERALEMQQELEYHGGTAARIIYPGGFAR